MLTNADLKTFFIASWVEGDEVKKITEDIDLPNETEIQRSRELEVLYLVVEVLCHVSMKLHFNEAQDCIFTFHGTLWH